MPFLDIMSSDDIIYNLDLPIYLKTILTNYPLELLADLVFCKFYSFFILILILIPILIFINKRIKSPRFLLYERNFDVNYMKMRRYLPLKSSGLIYPYEKLKNNYLEKLKKDHLEIELFPLLENKTVVFVPQELIPFYMSFIYEIFGSLKAILINCQSTPKRSFNKIGEESDENETVRLKIDDLIDKVRNILTVIPSVELLTLNEFIQIELLLNELAKNGIMKNENKRDLFNTLDLEKDTFIEAESFEQAKLIYYGLSKELNIKITVYYKMADELEIYSIGPAIKQKDTVRVETDDNPIISEIYDIEFLYISSKEIYPLQGLKID
jgi:hypothetical protein